MKIFTALSMFAVVSVLGAAPVMEIKNVSDLQLPWRGAAQYFSQSADGALKMTTNRPLTVESKLQPIIDPAKTYVLSGKIRKAPGSQGDSQAVIGIVSFDSKGNRIGSGAVYLFPATITRLAAPVKKGDTSVMVKDASKWNQKMNYSLIAFNAKADGSDVPNSDVSPFVAGYELTKEGYTEITLKSPMKKDYPADTEVRQQRASGTYYYVFTNKAPEDWKEFKVQLKGDAGARGVSYGKWWSGTRSMKLAIFCPKPVQVEFKDIMLDEVK